MSRYKLEIYRDVSFYGIESERFIARAGEAEKSCDSKAEAIGWLKAQVTPDEAWIQAAKEKRAAAKAMHAQRRT